MRPADEVKLMFLKEIVNDIFPIVKTCPSLEVLTPALNACLWVGP